MAEIRHVSRSDYSAVNEVAGAARGESCGEIFPSSPSGARDVGEMIEGQASLVELIDAQLQGLGLERLSCVALRREVLCLLQGDPTLDGLLELS